MNKSNISMLENPDVAQSFSVSSSKQAKRQAREELKSSKSKRKDKEKGAFKKCKVIWDESSANSIEDVHTTDKGRTVFITDIVEATIYSKQKLPRGLSGLVQLQLTGPAKNVQIGVQQSQSGRNLIGNSVKLHISDKGIFRNGALSDRNARLRNDAEVEIRYEKEEESLRFSFFCNGSQEGESVLFDYNKPIYLVATIPQKVLLTLL